MIKTLDAFRRSFFSERRALIGQLGPEAFDQGAVLYTCALTGRQVVVRDALPEAPSQEVGAFVQRVTLEWWTSRLLFAGDAEPGTRFEPTAGLYGRYLPAVGFDWCLELAPVGPMQAWRVDAREKATRLDLPADEEMFRDQTGTFFDLRSAWQVMVDRFVSTGELAVAEVQPGYVVGVRAGIPGDPAPEEREDPELMSHFSAWDPRDYDTLEFLNGPQAEGLPPSERWPEWLAAHADQIASGAVEIFALADSAAFQEAIVDLATARSVEVRSVAEARLRLVRGPLWAEVELDRPYLRTLHAGLSFAAGARAFFQPLVLELDEAFDLLTALRERLVGFAVTVESGTVVVIRAPGQAAPLGRWNLLSLVGRQDAHGSRGVDEVLAFFGYDPEARAFTRQDPPLGICPICGDPARVGKVVRPLALLGVDPRTLAGVAVGNHFIFFTRDCPRHSTPLEPRPDRPLATLEAAWQAGLPEAGIPLAEVRAFPPSVGVVAPDQAAEALEALPEGSLVVGFDAGSLVLEPALLKAALQAAERPASGRFHVVAFGPDAVVVSRGALVGPALYQARVAAEDAVRGLFPGRSWPLDVARWMELDMEPLGQVIWTR